MARRHLPSSILNPRPGLAVGVGLTKKIMRPRPILWFVISLLCLTGAYYFWQLGDQWAAEKKSTRERAVTKKASAPVKNGVVSSAGAPVALLTQPPAPAAAAQDNPLAFRLSNTKRTIGQLVRDDHALILENALLDTRSPMALAIPAHLRLTGDGGSYIVQSRRVLDDAFRAKLKAAGASIVAYIPNNAYLVRATASAAQQLAADAGTQTVLPFEPYYKLKGALLKAAVNQETLPEDAGLNLGLFADTAAATKEAIQKLGAEIFAEERTPFGPVVRVKPPTENWFALATLSGVQMVEPYSQRVTANDLSRVRLGISGAPAAATNYLNLTGTNVLVNVNDSGVDATHLDLTPLRVFADFATTLVDSNGHGTHVAGIIAGSGLQSITVSNAAGSPNPGVLGQYRGKAPGAMIFAQALFVGGRPGADSGGGVSDVALQEGSARTNAFISNNSWHYAGGSGYDLSAASYDAAVRDALPGVTGSQPVLFVFAAGNGGGGNDDGQGGRANTLSSPGTAKNVITVGATEIPRNITNDVWKCVSTGDTNNPANCTTNQPWQGMTSAENEVAGFSSRGNVGIGVEGEFGRFKPDVVAPGTFVVSTRSAQWDEKEYYNPTNHHYTTFIFQTIAGTNQGLYSIFVPENAVGLTINVFSTTNLPIYVWQGTDPSSTTPNFIQTNTVTAPPDGGAAFGPVGTTWWYAVGNPTANQTNIYDISTDLITTNDNGNYFQVLSNLNNSIEGTAASGTPPHYYRYESGTSMSAAEVSGTLALMQEFFEQRLQRTNSPALMKALLINGARSIGTLYDLQVESQMNLQGWGLVKLPNSLHGGLTNFAANLPASMWIADQSPTNALASGQTHTWKISPNLNARNFPLRATLVWTDPPGNPVAGVKLVNDLDLVVTNLDTGDVYFGNDIQVGGNFSSPWDTNLPPKVDVVNNVENIFIGGPLGTNGYSVTVRAQRINVNAVTAHTNDVVQDYALVLSSGDGQTLNQLTITEPPVVVGPTNAAITAPTNTFNTSQFVGSLLLGQHVGANTPLLGTTNGMVSQWHFYILTNTTAFTNAAFITFLPPTLSLPRIGARESTLAESTRVEADIDLYVSLNPALTNLDLAAIGAADKSRSRGGTEVVIYSNAVANGVYYIGVKSEDYMASEFGFIGVFSELPFSTRDEDGNLIVQGFPTPSVIPDGSPAVPGATLIFGVAVEPVIVRRVVVTNTIVHENLGDLLGNLSHGQRFAVLNNHRDPPDNPVSPGPYTFVYEDSGEEALFPPDGPGRLRDFVGEQGLGLWLLTMVDNSLTQTGRVEGLTLRIEPQNLDTNGVVRTVQPNAWTYDAIDVPVGATNLTICVSGNTGPMELYIRRDDFPTQTEYDKFLVVNPPGGCLSLTAFDLPPLAADRYYIGVFNSSGVEQTIRITATMILDINGVVPIRFGSGDDMPLLDDAVTNATQFVTNNQRIAQLEVGLRVNHPRVSDLAFTLISPTGTRVLLQENRGMSDNQGIGTSFAFTNVAPHSSSGGPTQDVYVVDTGTILGSLTVDYNFFTVPDRMTVYYEGAPIFDSGMIAGSGRFNINYGPGASTQVTFIMNEGGNTNATTQWNYTVGSVQLTHNYLIFSENTNRSTTPIKFLAPPFQPAPSAPPMLISGFEVASGDRLTSSLFDGWTVLTNQVTVIDDASLAASGNRLLALANGAISRTLPTTAGRSYRLNYGYRGPGIVSWWRGEGNTTDVVSGLNGTAVGDSGFAIGRVGQGFRFTGSASSGINIPNAPELALSNSISIEGWMYITNPPTDVDMLVFRGGSGGGFDPYTLAALPGGASGLLQFRIADPANNAIDLLSDIPLGNWTHIAGTLDGDSGVMRLYTNGVIANFTATLLRPLGPLTGNDNPGVGIGNHSSSPSWPYGFRGRLDELSIYKRALSASEVKAIYAAGAAGKFNPAAGVPANLAEVRVTLDNAKTNIDFGNNTIWQTNGLFFRASQNGTPLRVDGIQPGMLLDSFTLSETGDALYVMPEESLSAFDGENAFGEWRLEVWDSRTGASNLTSLVNWQLSFVFETTVAKPGALPNGTAFTNTVPPGQTAYFIVDVPPWARFATNTLIFATGPLDVWFNQNVPPAGGTNASDVNIIPNATAGLRILATDTNLYPAPQLLPGQRYYLGLQNSTTSNITYAIQVDFDITQLTNAVSLVSTQSIGSFPRYFFYDVSTNANGVSFQLFNLSGNANLVARKGLPLPTVTGFDYAGFNPGTNDEDIVVLTNSTPVALSAGRWYLGVFNADIVPVVYTILATEYVGLPPIITLTNGIPYFNTNSATGTATDYYRYVVSPAGARVQFEINGPTADVTLVAKKGLPLPDLVTFDYLGANTGTNDELIVVLTNSTPVILSPGDWFLSVVNISGGPAAYAIKATEWPLTGRPVIITNSGIVSNSFCFTWTSLPGVHYYVQGLTNLSSTNWVTIPPPVTAVDYFTTWCIPLPSPFQFFRVQEGLDVTNAPIVPPVVVTLTNGIPYANTNTPTVANPDYYRYVVSSNAARTQFEIYGAGADFTLVARKGLPLPSLATFDYRSANFGTNDELIVVLTNSGPVALTPGDWYLAAVNLSGAPVSYNILATEWAVTGQPVLVTGSTVSNGFFCITWNSLPGAHYYVEGLTNLSTFTWVTISPTITATATSTTFCVPLPSPYQFFRVRDGLALSSFASAPPTNTVVTAGTNGFTITWTGGLGARYMVEWSPTLLPPVWTSFTNIITSPNTTFSFLDDGTQTGGLGPLRFYRPYQIP